MRVYGAGLVLLAAAMVCGGVAGAAAPQNPHMEAPGGQTGTPVAGVPVAGPPVKRGKVVEYPSGGETVKGELFLPEGASRSATHPALILIHEWWGLNDWVREQAMDDAADGYVVLAVDLYRGAVANDAETAHELSRGLSHDRARRDLIAAYQFLRQRKDVGASGKIGTVGWCFGGGLALEFGIAEPGLSAIAVNYGALPTDEDALKKITAPVLGNFGALDRGIPPTAVESFVQQMRGLGKKVDVKEYPDAGHAFQNENNRAGYNAVDAADARGRTKLFLATNLR